MFLRRRLDDEANSRCIHQSVPSCIISHTHLNSTFSEQMGVCCPVWKASSPAAHLNLNVKHTGCFMSSSMPVNSVCATLGKCERSRACVKDTASASSSWKRYKRQQHYLTSYHVVDHIVAGRYVTPSVMSLKMMPLAVTTRLGLLSSKQHFHAVFIHKSMKQMLGILLQPEL